MFKMYLSKHQSFFRMLLLGCLPVLLVACGLDNSPNNTNIVTSASAVMMHNPLGTLQMSWDSYLHRLIVQTDLTGLAPKSSHPARIMAGNCRHPGKELYTLKDVV